MALTSLIAFPDLVIGGPFTFGPRFLGTDLIPRITTITGGSWQAALPLTNLFRPELAYVARSTDLTPASTQFSFSFDGIGPPPSAIIIPKTNGSLTCQYRISCPDFLPFDTGWQDLFQAGEGAYERLLYPMPIIALFSIYSFVTTFVVEFNDPDNEDGYFELSRILYMSAGFVPPYGMAPGASLVVEDPSIEQEALGGGLFFSDRPKRRVQRFSLNFLSDEDAALYITDMQMQLGKSGQLFFIHDTSSQLYKSRRSFLCRMRTISPLEYASSVNRIAPFELQEIVA